MDTEQIKAKAYAKGEQEMKDRIKAILAAPEAEGRTRLAEHIAFNMQISVEEARGYMAVAAKEAPPKPIDNEVNWLAHKARTLGIHDAVIDADTGPATWKYVNGGTPVSGAELDSEETAQ